MTILSGLFNAADFDVNYVKISDVKAYNDDGGMLSVPEKLVIPLDEPTSLENGCMWIV